MTCYSGNPGHAGTGTVVSVTCPTSSASLTLPEQSEFWKGEAHGRLENILFPNFKPHSAVPPALSNDSIFFESRIRFSEKQFSEEQKRDYLLNNKPG